MDTSSPKNQRQRFVDAIQERILNGDFGHGDPLRQVALSQEYGVSQSVVREGLLVLEQQGLVVSEDHRGVFVRRLDSEDLVDAYRVREVLEGLAARLCCRTASRTDIEWLENAAMRINAAQSESRQRRSTLEYEFHQRFLQLSGNDTLVRLSVGYRFVGNLVVTDRDADELLEEHLAVVRAVSDNKPEEAERLAREHVATSARTISMDS